MHKAIKSMAALAVLAALVQAGSVKAQVPQRHTVWFDVQLAREGLPEGTYNCAANRRPVTMEALRQDGDRQGPVTYSGGQFECIGVMHLAENLYLGESVTFWLKPDSWTAVYVQITNTSCDGDYCPHIQAYANPMYAGDASGDNVVNGTDWNILNHTYGKDCYTAGYDGRAEFTGDCLVNASDYNLLIGNYGVAGVGPLF